MRRRKEVLIAGVTAWRSPHGITMIFRSRHAPGNDKPCRGWGQLLVCGSVRRALRTTGQ